MLYENAVGKILCIYIFPHSSLFCSVSFGYSFVIGIRELNHKLSYGIEIPNENDSLFYKEFIPSNTFDFIQHHFNCVEFHF